MRAWFRSFHEKSTEVYGEPEKWEFDYPFDFVKLAFWLWKMSDFRHLPSQDEVAKYSSAYISDMKLAQWLYSHQGTENPMQKMVDDAVSKEITGDVKKSRGGIKVKKKVKNEQE